MGTKEKVFLSHGSNYSKPCSRAPRAASQQSIRYGGTMTKSLTLALLAASLVALPAAAHHGWSSYDSNNAITLTGTITEASYTYPHGTIMLETSGKTWLAVLAPPSRMSARGLPSSDLTVGAQATVEGYPSRQDPKEMRAERITIHGRTIELR